MNLLRKLNTALRGCAREMAEQAVDANGLRIFEQEISDCEQSILNARQDLSAVIAERLRLQREADSLQTVLSTKEQQTLEALEQDQQQRARQLAQWIASREPLLEDLEEKRLKLEQHELRLKEMLSRAVQQLESYRRELRLARATGSAQSAGFRLSQRPDDLSNQFQALSSSLERIQQRQQHQADRLKASEIIDSVLAEADIPKSTAPAIDERAAAVLERLRRSQQ